MNKKNQKIIIFYLIFVFLTLPLISEAKWSDTDDASNILSATYNAAIKVSNAAISKATSGLYAKELIFDTAAYAVNKVLMEEVSEELIDAINKGGIDGGTLYISNLDNYLSKKMDDTAKDFLKNAFKDLDSSFKTDVQKILLTSYKDAVKNNSELKSTITDVDKTISDLNKFWDWSKYTEIMSEPDNSSYGSLISASEKFAKNVEATEKIEQEKTEDGFSNKEECKDHSVSDGSGGTKTIKQCKTETPASSLSRSLSNILDLPNKAMANADEISEILGSILKGYIIDAVDEGISNLTDSDSDSAYSGSSSLTLGSSSSGGGSGSGTSGTSGSGSITYGVGSGSSSSEISGDSRSSGTTTESTGRVSATTTLTLNIKKTLEDEKKYLETKRLNLVYAKKIQKSLEDICTKCKGSSADWAARQRANMNIAGSCSNSKATITTVTITKKATTTSLGSTTEETLIKTSSTVDEKATSTIEQLEYDIQVSEENIKKLEDLQQKEAQTEVSYSSLTELYEEYDDIRSELGSLTEVKTETEELKVILAEADRRLDECWVPSTNEAANRASSKLGSSVSGISSKTGANSSDIADLWKDITGRSLGTEGCEKVAKTSDKSAGIFELETFKGKLYVGMFGYGSSKKSMLYDDKLKPISPGIIGVEESVCALEEYNGYFYANTESDGKIYKSADGKNWTKVYQYDHVGCGLTVFNGYIYATIADYQDRMKARIIRSSNGTNWQIVWANDTHYIRDIIAYKDKIYAFSVKNNKAYWHESSNGVNWTVKETEARFFRSHVFGGDLFLGASGKYTSSGTSGIWKYDGTTLEKVYEDKDKKFDHITQLDDLNGNLYAGASAGFKKTKGGGALLKSTDKGKTWKKICDFTEEEGVWAVENFNNTIYVGTWEDDGGGHGTLYKVGANLSSVSYGTDTGYHHYNARSILGGTALVLCPSSPEVKSCNGMKKHGGIDKGRQVFKNGTHKSGGQTITCTKADGGTISYKVPAGNGDARGLIYGKCQD